jgi:taurine dioxygenase
MQITPLSPAMGAIITDIDLSGTLLDTQIAELRQVWLDYQMIVIRGQTLSSAQYLAFAHLIGEPDTYPFLKGLEGYDQITPVLKREDETVNFGGLWHSDTTYMEHPPMATMLYAKELPPLGGDTLFASQTLAYEQLSEPFRIMLEGMVMQCRSDKGATVATRADRIEESGRNASTAFHATHPVIRTHPETGRQALFVNAAHTVSLDGLSDDESQFLLEFLFRHQIRAEFQCRLNWQIGDVAIWDNRSVLHYPLNDYHGYRRLLHRITLKGDKPVFSPTRN